nr:heme-binding protein [Ramlibacter albus]
MHGKNEWAAVVNREGELCAVAVSVEAKPQVQDNAAAWPGSKAIAKAKAFTANAFSTDTTPMSTARLYTMSLPGHSLWGAANGNPLNPKCITAPGDKDDLHVVCGGTITFGGGVPLYKGRTRIGGLGASGDTPCADHEVAKLVRDGAGLNPEGGKEADDIVYAGVDPPSIYQHPLCTNTWRNGTLLGNEGAALDAGGIAQALKAQATPASGVKTFQPASAASPASASSAAR